MGSPVVLNELLCTALLVEHTRSVANHLIVSVMLMLPAVIVGAVLLLAGFRRPGSAWLNLLWIAVLYGFWWLGGTLTKLARPDTEAADVGWMAMGLVFVTLPAWLLSIVLF